jgi:hypothetical protein
MAKAEISWKRTTDDGETVQCYAHQRGRDWLFYIRPKRYDVWRLVPEPPLEDWLALLDAVRRAIPRRRWMPKDEAHLLQLIRTRYPEADVGLPQFPV